MLHPVAEGRQDEHTDRHGQKGELRVTLLSLADQPRVNNWISSFKHFLESLCTDTGDDSRGSDDWIE